MAHQNFSKFHFYFLATVLSAILVALLVVAYGGTNPAVHGHDQGELGLGPINVDNINSRVGIGTTNPLAKLHVDNSNSAFYMGYGGNEDIYLQTNDGNILFTNKGATVERMKIASDGRVGINTSTPLSTLDIDGDVLADSFNGKTLSGTGLSCTTVIVANAASTYAYPTCGSGYTRVACMNGGQNQAATTNGANGCQCYNYGGGGFGDPCIAFCCKLS